MVYLDPMPACALWCTLSAVPTRQDAPPLALQLRRHRQKATAETPNVSSFRERSGVEQFFKYRYHPWSDFKNHTRAFGVDVRVDIMPANKPLADTGNVEIHRLA